MDENGRYLFYEGGTRASVLAGLLLETETGEMGVATVGDIYGPELLYRVKNPQGDVEILHFPSLEGMIANQEAFSEIFTSLVGIPVWDPAAIEGYRQGDPVNDGDGNFYISRIANNSSVLTSGDWQNVGRSLADVLQPLWESLFP